MTEDSKTKLKKEKKRKKEQVEEEAEQEENGIAASDALPSGLSCVRILWRRVADRMALQPWEGQAAGMHVSCAPYLLRMNLCCGY